MSCQKCNGTGQADSGGVQPWGEPIMVECDCQSGWTDEARAQEERAENAETELADLRERYNTLEAIARDFVRRNANGPLFYRDLYKRFEEALGD